MYSEVRGMRLKRRREEEWGVNRTNTDYNTTVELIYMTSLVRPNSNNLFHVHINPETTVKSTC